MLRSLYTAATGMDAQQTKLDIIAHNLANTSTTGFKRARADFEDLLSETIRSATAPTAQGGGRPEALQVGLGVRTATTTRSFAQGDMSATQNPLDIAIEGNGFFRIQRANGEFAYTRAGNFRTDATGRLVTQTGEIVDPGINIPTDATGITVRADGTVLAQVPGRVEPTELGAIHLAKLRAQMGSAIPPGHVYQSRRAGCAGHQSPRRHIGLGRACAGQTGRAGRRGA